MGRAPWVHSEATLASEPRPDIQCQPQVDSLGASDDDRRMPCSSRTKVDGAGAGGACLWQSSEERMEILKGTFGSLNNFLAWIALPNCVAYFQRAEAAQDLLHREQSRLLFNAAVSLDSAVDYRFSEEHQGRADEFRDNLFATNPELKELRELANAMKHAVRGRDTKQGFQVSADRLQASELVATQVSIKVDVSHPLSRPAVDVNLSADLLARADEILEAAFRYWIEQFQQF
jgi:hypothetical protein